MSKQPLTQSRGRNGRTQWIDILRYTLADICARGEWDDFGLFRILNRVLFLSRKQLAFVIYHTETGARIVDREISTFDPLLHSALFDHLKQHQLAVEHPETGEWTINKTMSAPYEIRLFDTHNRIILLEMEVVNPTVAGREPKLEFKPVLRTSPIGAFYVDVFQPFDGKKGRMLFDVSFEQHFSALRAAGAYQKSQLERPEDAPLNELDFAQLNGAARDVNDLAGGEYQRLSKSPLLKSFLDGRAGIEGRIANLVFTSKLFNRNTTRYRAYHYDPVFLMSDDQLRGLATGLACVSRDELIPFAIEEYDRRFWLLQQTNEGISRIINAIRRPWPQSMRLFVENALMSGATMIKPDIFTRSGLTWIDGEGLSNAEIDACYERSVCLHYIMQLGSPVEPASARSLSVLSIPFRCSGGIWMAASYVRENVGTDKVGGKTSTVDGLISQDQFHREVLIYHSLLRETERRLRTKARRTYIEALARLVTEAAHESRATPAHLSTTLDTNAIRRFNHRAKILTRLYPFHQVEIGHSADQVMVHLKDLTLRSSPNAFFDRLTLYEFLREDSTAERLRERISYNAITALLDVQTPPERVDS